MELESRHPIHDIPNELLSKIFLSITQFSLRDWYEATASAGVGWTLPFPMLVSATCQHWRQVAINTPELWGTIYVPMFVAEKPRRALLYDATKFTTMWLGRSKAAPLEIYLSIPESVLAFDLAADVIMPKVMKQAHRLRTLVINGHMGNVSFPNARGILSAISTAPIRPVLRTLSVRFSGGLSNTSRITESTPRLDRYWELPPGSAFQLPQVEELHIEALCISASFFPNLVALNVINLTSTFDEFSQIFSSLPHLRRLSLHCLRVLTESSATPEAIVVPNLDFLSLSFTRRPWTSDASYPATYLRLPGLKTLVLDGDSSVPICSCLDPAFFSSLDKVDTLRLSRFVRFAMDERSDATRNDIERLRQLSTVRHMELISTSLGSLLVPRSRVTEDVEARPRRASISRAMRGGPGMRQTIPALDDAFLRLRTNAHLEPEGVQTTGGTVAEGPSNTPALPASTPSAPAWPNLETISLESIAASDVVGLCEYIATAGHIKAVCLSSHALRHLSETVKRKIADDTFFALNFATERKHERDLVEKERGDGSGVESAQEWLQRRVRILPLV